MSAIAGLLSLSSGPSTNEWVSEYQEGILVRNAKGYNSGATLFGLMSRLKSEPAETTEFKWFERDPVTRVVYAAQNQANDGNFSLVLSLPVSGNLSVTGLVQAGTILRHDSSGEYYRVTSISSTHSNANNEAVVATRGWPGNPSLNATDIAANDSMTIITFGANEGGNAIDAVYETASTLTNYIQTFKSTVEITNAFKGSKLRTDIEGPLKERRIQALERIARDIELAYLFGHAKGGTVGGWYTGGVKDAVDQLTSSLAAAAATYGTTNVLNGNGSTGTVLQNVNDWLATFMTVGSDAKLMFAGPATYAAFSTFANQASNGFRITGAENVFGMNITTIQTPFGALDLAMHPLMKEIGAFNDWGVVVDLGLVTQKVMEPLFLEPNIQTPGADSYKEQFRAKLGLKLKFAEAFGYCYDLSVIL